MFDSLSDRLGDVFDRLRRHGALTEDDVGAAMREIRVALLEADVALPVVRDFVAAVREKALGQEVLRSVTPAQMVVKIVHDHLVEVLGGGAGTAWRRPRRRDRSERPGPGRGHAGRAAGLGQDDDRGEDRAAAQAAPAQEGIARLARRAAAGRPGAARRARPPDRRDLPADRAGRKAGRDHPASAAHRSHRRATTSSFSTPPAGSTSTKS